MQILSLGGAKVLGQATYLRRKTRVFLFALSKRTERQDASISTPSIETHSHHEIKGARRGLVEGECSYRPAFSPQGCVESPRLIGYSTIRLLKIPFGLD